MIIEIIFNLLYVYQTLLFLFCGMYAIYGRPFLVSAVYFAVNAPIKLYQAWWRGDIKTSHRRAAEFWSTSPTIFHWFFYVIKSDIEETHKALKIAFTVYCKIFFAPSPY